MSQQTEKRPLVAALLSFLQPGLGHLYLREWLRAVLWAGLWVGSLIVVADSAGLDLADPGALVAAVGFFTNPDALPVEVVLTALSVTAFATLDAYWLTARNNHRLQNRTGRCEECGERLDPSLEFCHWCTTPRDDERSA